MGAPHADSRRSLAVALGVTAAVKAATLGLGLGPLWNTGAMSHMVQDLRTWASFFRYAQAGLVPYVDFFKEYPVGAGLLYWAMSPFVAPDDVRQVTLVHALFMLPADALNVVLAHRLFQALDPRRALAFTLLLNLNLTALVLAPLRFEGWIVTFVLAGYLAHRAGRPLLAAAAWSAGSWLKWFPSFFIAAQEWRGLVVEGKKTRWLLAGAVFVGVALALNGPFLALNLARRGNLEMFLAPYRFHLERPLYWDTLLGVGQIWLGPLPWERHGSLWTLGLVVAALVARPSLGVAPKGVLMCAAALVFNRIYSTQFHLWFYPFLLVEAIRARGRRFPLLLGLFAALDVVNVLVYPVFFTGAVEEMRGFRPFAARDLGEAWTIAFSAAIVVRTLLVVVLASLMLRSDDTEGPGRS